METPYPRDAVAVIPLVIDQSQTTRGIRGRRKSIVDGQDWWGNMPCWPRTNAGLTGPAILGNPPSGVDTTMDAWLSCTVGATTYYVPAWTD